MAERRIENADLERWVQRGLITADQGEALRRDLAEHRSPQAGITLTILLYYGGGLLVLVAYSIFLGLQWQEMNEAGRMAIAALSLLFFTAASYVMLRFERLQLPGELLQVVAVAVVPLLTFSIIDAAGLWPEDPGAPPFSSRQEEYQIDLVWARMVIGGATLAASLAAFRWSRSPFVLVAGAVSLGSVIVDASIAAQGAREEYIWETSQAMIVAALGAASLVAGIALRSRTERDYTLWFYIMGLAGLGAGLANKAFYTDAAGWGALWMLVALVVLGLSIPLQQRLFAAAGLGGILAYLANLVFDVFESTNAALVLVLLGVIILGLGVLYQRYSERLFPGERGRPEQLSP